MIYGQLVSDTFEHLLQSCCSARSSLSFYAVCYQHAAGDLQRQRWCPTDDQTWISWL